LVCWCVCGDADLVLTCVFESSCKTSRGRYPAWRARSTPACADSLRRRPPSDLDAQPRRPWRTCLDTVPPSS
jgi:hypothetical protein